MKISYLLDTHAGPYDRPAPTRDEVSGFIDHLYREMEIAENTGFETLLVPERHARTECFFPSTLLLMSAIAARTSRIKIGSYILILPLYNPMHVAEQVAMIDQMSKGRVILGIASGYHPDYQNMFAEPFKRRGKRFDEAVEILKLAWTGEKFSWDGKEYQFDDVFLTPRPYQDPRPTLWLGGMFPKTIARAGRVGDAWCSDPFPLQRDVWLEQVKLYRDTAKEHGNRSKVVLMRDGWVAPTRAQAEEEFGQIFVDELLFYHNYGILTHHPDFRSKEDFTIERARRHCILGSPDDCIEQLEAYARDYDVDEMVMRFRLPKGPAPDKVLKCLQLFGDEVVPHFNKA